ncbi:methionyl-tRNA formyltransferase [Candidatus Xianfuyuplasma coldseepsis]|uniref:Methionyl-tRNA formyltransferase n=1 Tax=Candidatus Xianfuyuplasma coldseepsis TaxID=2782163 RepID=A0A7L7KQV4_9MOLU|nr:methionyl-tRNA formyltransferase [Xianfuyuplasma coldseepsis]QMS84334.1 methionyl-tRNA formyltransferase [Xianfuyuplasma coldseepsis]
MNIVFMGTPQFSVRILEAVHDKYGVTLVVTQPDKRVGRKRVLTYSPIKEKALELKIPVFQPRRIKQDFDVILDTKPDLIITAAYGQIIPNEVLDAPRLGCINVHGSLLPQLRGGAPIQRAIQRLYVTTGITIMYMAQQMDSGDIISQRSITIQPYDTSGTLFEKLSVLGRDLLMDTLPDIVAGTNSRTPQDESLVTYAYNLKRDEEHINWGRSCEEIDAHIRAFTPEPQCYSILDNKRLKILEVQPCTYPKNTTFDQYQNGTIVEVQKEYFGVKAEDGVIKVFTVQLEGKTKQDVKTFMNGSGRNMIKLYKVFQ